ncbi:hypothetical protein LTR78_007123 [Recurvomyces mirabilis]|uniref:DUF1996 domain-containing protein n=1 Tax=Recurvomyces mirabilis TaxID=574656 RepID=A0AAE0WJS6_9PEZI|nr:hypothetical protein LTR78_007123 [Recurvomyces mirabilis]KAK5150905.1 hypothetical protein LTS14_009708 [Recurvomyces mirabilis]
MAPTLLSITTLLSLSVIHAVASSVWTLNCAPLLQARLDPIKQPGVWPSSHVHAVVGSTAFAQHMIGVSSGKATTCDKATDHSNYWSPTLYHMRSDGQYDLLPFTGMVAYYQNYTCSHSSMNPGYCPSTPRDAQAFPPGLRMLAGDSDRRTLNKTDQWQQAILLESGNNGEVYGMPPRLDGSRISGHVRFPSCWDGKNLDSPDHKSHMAYPDPVLHGDTQGGMCPLSHPVALLNIGAEFGWSLNGITDPGSLVFANGDTTGYGFHADFFMGWENPTALQDSFANCMTNDNCPWRKFGSPTGMDPNPISQTPDVLPPLENIGLSGPVGKLPGNNAVFKGHSKRYARGV